MSSSDEEIEEVSDLHAEVGMALYQWVQIENGVVFVFWSASELPDFESASKILHVAPSFHGRLLMANAAVDCAFSRGHFSAELLELDDPWSNISKAIDDLKPLRNDIAHYSTFYDSEMENGQRAYLAPSRFDLSKKNFRAIESGRALRRQDVARISSQFADLSMRLVKFTDSIPYPSDRILS